MPYANPFRRLIAYWIDITLLYALVFGLQFGFAYLTDWPVANWLAATNNGFLIYAWIVSTTSVLMWLYFILLERSPRQATLGKRWMGLLVTDCAGNRLTLKRAALRTAAKLAFFEIGHLSFLFPTPLFNESNPPFRVGFLVVIALMAVYFFFTLVTPKRQSIHDLLAGTLVVRRSAT
jgi:uncharacterized RDD family membrane protein YckC